MPPDAIEVRLARLEGSYEQIDKRLGAIEPRRDNVEAGLTALRTELHEGLGSLGTGLRGEISELRRETQARDRWLAGIIIVAWIVPIVLRFIP